MKISSRFRSWLAAQPRVERRPRTSIFAVGLTVCGLVALCSLATLGCGNTLYLVQVNNAEEDLEEAKQVGAPQYAPYEYYAAEARLEEAKKQAAQAEYGNASQLSDEASVFAEAAIVKSKKAREARGAPPQRTGALQ